MQGPKGDNCDIPPVPSINCWYSTPMEVEVTSASKVPAAAPEPVEAEEDDYFSPDPDLSHLLTPSALSAGEMPLGSGLVVSSWLSLPASFCWNTSRLVGVENMQQSPDVLFQPQELFLQGGHGGAPVGAASSLHHWMRLSLMAAVQINQQGKLTFWWAHKSR